MDGMTPIRCDAWNTHTYTYTSTKSTNKDRLYITKIGTRTQLAIHVLTVWHNRHALFIHFDNVFLVFVHLSDGKTYLQTHQIVLVPSCIRWWSLSPSHTPNPAHYPHTKNWQKVEQKAVKIDFRSSQCVVVWCGVARRGKGGRTFPVKGSSVPPSRSSRFATPLEASPPALSSTSMGVPSRSASNVRDSASLICGLYNKQGRKEVNQHGCRQKDQDREWGKKRRMRQNW